jgi:hypothetical protein
MRGKGGKKTKTGTSAARGNEALTEVLAPGYPFYTFNEDTYRLFSLASYAEMLEEFNRLWHDYQGGPGSEFEVVQHVISNTGRLNWLPESSLMRGLASLLGRGDAADAFQCFSKALKAYEESFASYSNKDQAKIHLMMACNSLCHEGRNRDEVTKAEIEMRARQLWAQSRCRQRHRDLSQVNIEREERNLPHVDWPLIRREIGLDNLRSSKPGRKPIGNKRQY